MSILFAVIGLLIYLVPTIIAFKLNQSNKGTVALVNVFLGITVFGWIAAFILAFTGPAQPENADQA